MKEDITKALINLHERTGKEWIDLKSIYEEVQAIRGVPNVNEGASIRRTLETYTKGFDTFGGEELYESYEKGSGLYKSCAYERYKFIKNINIGDSFTREQLMNIFKISGQSGMMKTNLLNALVLITSEENGIYGDSGIENGTIQYTGEGQIGDQTITKNNKTLFYSKENNIPVYLFSKDNKRRYTFEGRVELYDYPYQIYEKDINNNERKVWKFPLAVIYSDEDVQDEKIKEVSYEIVEIENKIYPEMLSEQAELEFVEGAVNIRKYRKTDRKNQRSTKPDYVAEEVVKSIQGVINEKKIYEQELNRLMAEEAEEQVKKMEEFFKNKKENEGYDILSFESDDNGQYIEKYIEVKSTKSGEGTPIEISPNELDFARKHIDNYYLYRIYYSDSKNPKYKIILGKELLDDSTYNLVPSKYEIYLK